MIREPRSDGTTPHFYAAACSSAVSLSLCLSSNLRSQWLAWLGSDMKLCLLSCTIFFAVLAGDIAVTGTGPPCSGLLCISSNTNNDQGLWTLGSSPVYSGPINGSFVSDRVDFVNSRPRRQTRNKKKRKRNNNRKGGRNIRKSSKRGSSNPNKIKTKTGSKKCLNTGMNWRSYQSSVVISK